MHARVSARNGQTYPPFAACCVTLRERDCAPVPHDFVHAVQGLNADVWQRTGHGPRLHTFVSAVCGHAAPPHTGCCNICRVRLCTPASHVLLQALHTEGKTPALQSTAQQCVLHARVSALCGHALPPKRGAVMARVRRWTPPLHDAEHAVHAPNDAPTTQSSGQSVSLHARVSDECGHAALLPPHVGCTNVRIRDCEPAPHDLEHVLQALNAPATQPVGQQLWLHARVSCACGHAIPPWCGPDTCL